MKEYACTLVLLCCVIYIDIYIYNDWCPLVHLFGTLFQNSPYGHDVRRKPLILGWIVDKTGMLRTIWDDLLRMTAACAIY